MNSNDKYTWSIFIFIFSQVTSQKCRRKNLRTPKERKHIHHATGQEFSKDSMQRSSFQEYGTMPLQINVPILQHDLDTNKNFVRGESSNQKQLYRPQLQVQACYLNIDNRFNISFNPAQNYVGDGLQQQHGPLLEMLNSQGL